MSNSPELVFSLLTIAFTAVGIHLWRYGRKRKRLMQQFAKSQGVSFKPELIQLLEQTLEACFTLPYTGLVRSFAQFSNLINAGEIQLFQCVELLDLNPHAHSESTHFSRIAALYKVDQSEQCFFIYYPSGTHAPRLAQQWQPSQSILEKIEKPIKTAAIRHPLSITINNGMMLIYFEPLITGGESAEDIKALYQTAKRLHQALTH